MNKGHPNKEAIKTFDKSEGAGQVKGAQGVEPQGEQQERESWKTKPGNVTDITSNEPERVRERKTLKTNGGHG